MNKILKMIFWVILLFQMFSITFAATWKYTNSIENAIAPIQNHLNTPQIDDPQWWWNTVVNFLFDILDVFVIPIVISIWIVIWMVWAYRLLFSGDEKQMSSWLKMLVFWVIWVIIMVSAKYIWNVLFEQIFESGNITGLSWIEFSQSLYEKIVYPFIKIALYLALAVIFVVLVWKSIGLITKSDWTSTKTALWMIWRCTVSILIIIGAKSIVEAVYGKQEDVFNNAQNLWDIWSAVLADKNIPIVYNIISWILWIISLVIFILLLVQWLKILISPSKSENFQKLWKSLLYTVIWLFIIGIWYLIVNAFVLN